MEGLNGFLSSWNSIIENVGKLIWGSFLIVVLLNELGEFNRYNIGVFNSEGLSKLFLSDIIRDELNVDVRVEGLCQVLGDWIDL